MMNSPQLFVGLGNPGAQYDGHRHNAGFMALDAIAEAEHAGSWQSKFHGLLTEISVHPSPSPTTKPSAEKKRGQNVRAPLMAEGLRPIARAVGERGGELKILLLKPQTYMNKSGLSVAEACRFYKIPPEAVTVFHDELDLPFGTLRLKRGGGHGGHNGLRDIDAHIGKDYRRIRIGIGHPGHKDAVTGYVLHDFSKDEQKTLPNLWDEIIHILPLLTGGTDTEIMNRLHGGK